MRNTRNMKYICKHCGAPAIFDAGEWVDDVLWNHLILKHNAIYGRDAILSTSAMIKENYEEELYI